ncbi:MAG: selenocysteine-specific translation elongation factor [Planctomycetota bacterium]|jgi:selenocysteine-specific elongation factor
MPAHDLILGTAGHIDHGKTALVRALTGIDTDRLEQEKQRGISIDIGFAHLELDDVRLGIVDVPGHERFIRNMLAGAAGIDLALLVVAADDSVMPQTREHLAILELLRIEHGVIALTKADLAEPDWLDLVEADVRELTAGTFLAGAPIVRTSATDGRGLDDLRAALAAAAARVATPDDAGLFRMWIDRSFALPGLGTVVTGSVAAGAIGTGDEVAWLPGDRRLRVRGIQCHGVASDTARRGQRAALDLTGVHHAEIRRGHVVAAPGAVAASRRLTAHVRVLPDSPWPLRHRARVRLHLGTQEVVAEVRLLRGTVLGPGEHGAAQLLPAEPVAAVARQPFVVRSESPVRTIGGGMILQPAARHLARREPDAIARLAALADDDPGPRCAAAVSFLGTAPWTIADLCRDADVGPAVAERVLADLEADGRVERVPLRNGRIRRLHRDVAAWARRRVLDGVARLHAEHPLATAVPRDRLASRLDYVDRDVLGGLVDGLVDTGGLVGDEQAVALPDFRPALTDAQRRLREQVLGAYRDAGFNPPDAAEVARVVGTSGSKLAPILQLCVQQRELTHLADGLYLHRDWEEALRRRIADALHGGRGMTVSEIRDTLGTTRKYAVPLCEYLDRIGVTRRREDLRILATA